MISPIFPLNLHNCFLALLCTIALLILRLQNPITQAQRAQLALTPLLPHPLGSIKQDLQQALEKWKWKAEPRIIKLFLQVWWCGSCLARDSSWELTSCFSEMLCFVLKCFSRCLPLLLSIASATLPHFQVFISDKMLSLDLAPESAFKTRQPLLRVWILASCYNLITFVYSLAKHKKFCFTEAVIQGEM